MPLSDTDRTAIGDAERRLLDPAVRGDATALSALLADDFVEIGASGRRYTKAAVIASLADESSTYRATLTDLEVTELAPNLAIARYRTEARDTPDREPRYALRTSLWRRGTTGWQLLHHQGTPTAAP